MRLASLFSAALAASVLASCTIEVLAQECEVRAPRSATVDAAGANKVHIQARGGDLSVRGESSSAQVLVDGEACATSQELLDRIELIAERRGDEVWIEAVVPSGRGSRRLDMEIAIPEGLAAVIRDSSGDVTLEDLAAVDLQDSSGDVTLRGARGDVRVQDSSGELEIADVDGALAVTDNSGDIDIRGVRGEVVIERDGSGDIEARNLGSNFVVRSDGSGGIRATDVAGDFIVERDGSGDVRFARVGGRTPTKRR